MKILLLTFIGLSFPTTDDQYIVHITEEVDVMTDQKSATINIQLKDDQLQTVNASCRGSGYGLMFIVLGNQSVNNDQSSFTYRIGKAPAVSIEVINTSSILFIKTKEDVDNIISARGKVAMRYSSTTFVHDFSSIAHKLDEFQKKCDAIKVK